MTLTANDWDRLLALLDNGWPGDLTEDAGDAYRVLLADIEPDRILQGLNRLLHAGARFRPSAAEILAEARHDPSIPTCDEALHLIYGPGGVMKARPPYTGPRLGENATIHAVNKARLERAATMHPLVASFVARRTLDVLGRMDPIDSEWDRKELREAWTEHVDTQDHREVAALASGRGAGELKRLDPLAALTAPPQPQHVLTETTEGEAAA